MSAPGPKLGGLAPLDAQRDAVHVAVVPCVAGCELAIGQPVGLNADKEAMPATRGRAIGVVDPFLAWPVEAGQRFWLFLKPGTVSNLRHSWSHPLFAHEEDEVEAAETAKPMTEAETSIAWLQKAATSCGVNYEVMMHRIEQGDYINMGENERYKALDYDEFARHVKVVTGKDNVYPPFSCSC